MPRIFPTQITRMLLLLVALVVGGTLGYMLIEGWQLRDALFMTVTTLSTVGYGEVHPLSPAGEYFSMLLIFSGVGVLFYAFGVVMDYVVAGELQGVLARQRMARKIATMADHFIVCGFGRMGRQVVEELHANAINVVVVDLDASVAPELAQQKIPFIAGDPSSDEILQRANLQRAKGLCTCLPNDATNVFVVLSARQANPQLRIISRCNEPANQQKLRIAGADEVINPYAITGRRMAASLIHPSVADFLDVVMRRGDLELRLQEIVVSPTSPLAGQTLAAARVRTLTGVNVLAIRRNQVVLETRPIAEFPLQAGDELISLGTEEQLVELAKQAGDHRRGLHWV